MRPCLCPLFIVPQTVLITILWILQPHILLWGLCTCWFPTWNAPPISITMAHFLTLVRPLPKCHLLKETHLDHWSEIEVLATFCTPLFRFLLIYITTWCLFLAISGTTSYLRAEPPLSCSLLWTRHQCLEQGLVHRGAYAERNEFKWKIWKATPWQPALPFFQPWGCSLHSARDSSGGFGSLGGHIWPCTRCSLEASSAAHCLSAPSALAGT